MGLFHKIGLAAFVVLPITTAQAGLLEVLRDNGTINAEQYKELSAEKAAPQKYIKASDTNIKFVGRFYADFAHYQEDITPLASGGELRTARLEAKGKFKENWKFKAQFALDNNTTTSRYIWLGYQFDNSILKVGRTAEANGMEDYTSSRFITFMERALPVTAFEGDFGQGLEYNWWNDNSGLQVSALLDTGKPVDTADADGDGNVTELNGLADEKFKWSARYHIAPVMTDENIVHFGVHANYINPPANTARVRTRPESHVTDTRLLNTGTLNNVDGVSTNGIELAWIGGPMSVQAEYLTRDISIQGGQDLTFDGFYIFGSYFLTGHTRNYDAGSGSIGRTKLDNKGAVELALRYSALDLNDKTVIGGEGNNVTLGVNWWPRKNVKLAFNQIFASVENRGVGVADEDYGITQVRAQLDW